MVFVPVPPGMRVPLVGAAPGVPGGGGVLQRWRGRDGVGFACGAAGPSIGVVGSRASFAKFSRQLTSVQPTW
eukprot:4945029-Pyramimonas_sp.AAC.1